MSNNVIHKDTKKQTSKQLVQTNKQTQKQTNKPFVSTNKWSDDFVCLTGVCWPSKLEPTWVYYAWWRGEGGLQYKKDRGARGRG